MKIKLTTESGYLMGVMVLKTPHKTIRTTFILDTGSPQTLIGYSDSRRLQIPFTSCDKNVEMGGRKYKGYLYDKVTAIFLSEDNKPIEENLGDVEVVRPNSLKEIDDVDRIPTLIGTDFLKRLKYKLFCDFAKNDAYLEKN